MVAMNSVVGGGKAGINLFFCVFSGDSTEHFGIAESFLYILLSMRALSMYAVRLDRRPSTVEKRVPKDSKAKPIKYD